MALAQVHDDGPQVRGRHLDAIETGLEPAQCLLRDVLAATRIPGEEEREPSGAVEAQRVERREARVVVARNGRLDHRLHHHFFQRHALQGSDGSPPSPPKSAGAPKRFQHTRSAGQVLR